VALHRRFHALTLLGEREFRVRESDDGELVASARLGELPGGCPALHRADPEQQTAVTGSGSYGRAGLRAYRRARHLVFALLLIKRLWREVDPDRPGDRAHLLVYRHFGEHVGIAERLEHASPLPTHV
jgi:hypothetical protein